MFVYYYFCRPVFEIFIQLVKPYKDSRESKKEQIELMFDNIAPKYDFLNHCLSMNIDKQWRKKLVFMLGKHNPLKILDLATGTGDLIIEMMKLEPEKIVGLDISEEMLRIADRKISIKDKPAVVLKKGSAENIPFKNNSFDAVTSAFGVRNFEDLELGLKEMLRILKPGGMAAILEFSKPHAFFFKNIYSFYFKKLLPFIGRIISKEVSAYSYLPESVDAFPDGENFLEKMRMAGFIDTELSILSSGIATIYIAKKGNNVLQ